MKRISEAVEEWSYKIFEDAKWEKFLLVALLVLLVFIVGVQFGMWHEKRLENQLWEETYRQKREIERRFQPPPLKQPIPAKEIWL